MQDPGNKPLSFYVKSILESLEGLKLPFKGSEFCRFAEFQLSKSAKIIS